MQIEKDVGFNGKDMIYALTSDQICRDCYKYPGI